MKISCFYIFLYIFDCDSFLFKVLWLFIVWHCSRELKLLFDKIFPFIIDFLFSNILKYGHWLYRPRHQYFDHCEITYFKLKIFNEVKYFFFVIWIFRCQFKTWKLILKCQERKKLEEWLGVIKGRPSHLLSGWGVSRRPLFPQPHQPAVVGLLAVQIAAQFSTAVLRFRFVKS